MEAFFFRPSHHHPHVILILILIFMIATSLVSTIVSRRNRNKIVSIHIDVSRGENYDVALGSKPVLLSSERC